MSLKRNSERLPSYIRKTQGYRQLQIPLQPLVTWGGKREKDQNMSITNQQCWKRTKKQWTYKDLPHHTSKETGTWTFWHLLPWTPAHPAKVTQKQPCRNLIHNNKHWHLNTREGVTQTWGWVTTEFEDIATTARPFCRQYKKLLSSKKEHSYKANKANLWHLHIDIGELYNVFLQVNHKGAMITDEHNLTKRFKLYIHNLKDER